MRVGSTTCRGLRGPLTGHGFLGAAAAAALATQPFARAAPAAPARLPAPSRSGLDHVVLVMMENRSFDHLLGRLPGADGKQAEVSANFPFLVFSQRNLHAPRIAVPALAAGAPCA